MAKKNNVQVRKDFHAKKNDIFSPKYYLSLVNEVKFY